MERKTLSPSSFTMVVTATIPGVCLDTLIPEKPYSRMSPFPTVSCPFPLTAEKLPGVISSMRSIFSSGYRTTCPSITSPESQL